MLKKILVLTTILIILVLIYGYWHVSTYGWLHLSIRDVSSKERKNQPVKDAKVILLGSNSKVLAEGKSDSRHGVVYLSHPEVGFCVEKESQAPFLKDARQTWHDCYEKQAKWVVEWAENIKYVDLEFDECRLKKVPVSVSKYKDEWWIWWFPHPHIGGKPSTYFSINIYVDSADCKIIAL